MISPALNAIGSQPPFLVDQVFLIGHQVPSKDPGVVSGPGLESSFDRVLASWARPAVEVTDGGKSVSETGF